MPTPSRSAGGFFVQSPGQVRGSVSQASHFYFATNNLVLYFYNDAQDTWTALTSGPQFSSPSKVVYFDGAIWGVGLRSTVGSRLVRWNGGSSSSFFNSWSAVTVSIGYNEADLHAFDVVEYNSLLYVLFGFRDGTGKYLPVVAYYDPGTGTWTDVSSGDWYPLSFGVNYMSRTMRLVVSDSGILYVSAPSTTDSIFSSSGGVFTPVKPLFPGNSVATDLLVLGAEILAHGNVNGFAGTYGKGSWTAIDSTYYPTPQLYEWFQVWGRSMVTMDGVGYCAALLYDGASNIASVFATISTTALTERLRFADLGLTTDQTDATVRAMIPVSTPAGNRLLVAGDFTHIDGTPITGTRNVIWINPADWSYEQVQPTGSGPGDVVGLSVMSIAGNAPSLETQADVAINTDPNFSLQLALQVGSASVEGWTIGGPRAVPGNTDRELSISTAGLISWAAPAKTVGSESSPFTIDVMAGNPGGWDTISFLLYVQDTAPTIAALANDSGSAGSPYSRSPSLSAGDEPATWSIITGPAGATIDESSGEVSWPSPTAGVTNWTIQASNAVGSDTESWSTTFS